MFRKFWKKLWEIIYPEVCVFCGKLCKEGICPACRERVKAIREPRCKRCGKPVRFAEQEFCYDCQNRVFAYEQGKSLWLHKDPVNRSIYAFKYQNRRAYGEVYGREMAKAFETVIRRWGIDLIVPVPLHKKRRRKRGFNQAEILAETIGEALGIPVSTKLVIRERYTEPQKQLNRGERKKNLEHAFAVTQRRVSARRILIVDDIYTTGSTIHFVAETLLRAGAEKTYFLTISIGQGF